MAKYPLILFQPCGESDIATEVANNFATKLVTSTEDCLALAAGEEFKVLVLDFLCAESASKIQEYEHLFKDEALDHLSILLLSPNDELRSKLLAFEMGCDDVIDKNTSAEEMCARINKSIFHSIANGQLKSRLSAANETAFSAMSDNSDLGSNLQFLVEENNCENLDELGQLFFAAIERYGLSCSLQMRSVYGIKNMDANGLAKDLESQLLEQLQDTGRFVDFGRRTIINFDQVSLLIRNMPVDDTKRYGSIKDNFPALLQGVDARIKALDARNQLIEEKDALRELSSNVCDVMSEIDNSYQRVMRDIATVVEDMADAIQSRIPSLALSEEQEQFFESVVNTCVVDTNRVFNEGLKVDQVFLTLKENMDIALSKVTIVEQSQKIQAPPHHQTPTHNSGIELF